jgi:RNA polymerase sigma factor (sigma-70 family)
MRAGHFERLYAEHAEALFGFLVYRTGNRAEAEDIVADTFERAMRARRRFDPRRASEKTWLYSIAVNRLRDLARREVAHERALQRTGAAGSEGADTGTEGADARLAVQAALAALSPEEREAVALRFGADLPLKEIASVLDESMTTVEGRVYRALRKLRAEMGDEAAPGA